MKLHGQINSYDEEGRLIAVEGNLESVTYSYDEDDNLVQETRQDEFGQKIITKYLYNQNHRMIYKETSDGDVEENFYDSKDQLIETRTYHKEDPSMAKVSKFHYDDKGNVSSLDGILKDCNGKKRNTKIEYVPGTSLTRKIVSPSGQTKCYNYDKWTQQVSSFSSDADGQHNVIKYQYQCGLLTDLSDNDQHYKYTYDALGRIKAIDVCGVKDYITFEYKDYQSVKENEAGAEHPLTLNHAFTVTEKHLDDDAYQCESVYDMDGKLRKFTENGNRYDYLYDNNGRLRSIFGPSYEVQYNEKGEVSSITENQTKKELFRENGKVKEIVETIQNDGTVFHEKYSYQNRLVSSVDHGRWLMDYEYDALKRNTREVISKIKDQTKEPLLENSFTYLQIEDQTFDQIKEHQVKVNQTLMDSFEYQYDASGNIVKCITDDDDVTRYQYDSVGRLIREDNAGLNRTFTYKYDSRGNLILKKKYQYTLEDNLYGQMEKTRYSYSSGEWKDQLVKVNATSISYDKLGRMTKKGSTELKWDKDKLTTYGNVSFTYYPNGVRASKTVTNDQGTLTTQYDAIGAKILRERTGQDVITFIYSMEKLIGFEYNGARYLYERNIQGDIIKIYQESDFTRVAEYCYDAFGNQRIVFDAGGIASLNPFRYR